MTIEQAIQRAIEGGYLFEARYRSSSRKIAYLNKDDMPALKTIPEMLMEMDFWQSLGKATGWNEGKQFYEDGMKLKTWKREWHRFIDHLAEGKSAEDFFKTLTH